VSKSRQRTVIRPSVSRARLVRCDSIGRVTELINCHRFSRGTRPMIELLEVGLADLSSELASGVHKLLRMRCCSRRCISGVPHLRRSDRPLRSDFSVGIWAGFQRAFCNSGRIIRAPAHRLGWRVRSLQLRACQMAMLEWHGHTEFPRSGAEEIARVFRSRCETPAMVAASRGATLALISPTNANRSLVLLPRRLPLYFAARGCFARNTNDYKDVRRILNQRRASTTPVPARPAPLR
jgi:hypothetical protein